MQDQDSEPLFGQDVYSLLREDSLLTRTGSNNFAALIDNSPDIPVNPQQQVQQHNVQPQQAVVFQEQPEAPRAFYYTEVQQATQQQDQMLTVSWNELEGVDGDLVVHAPIQCQQQQQHQHQQQQQVVSLVEDDQQRILVPDSSSIIHTPVYPPSLQPWPGRHQFTFQLPTDNKDRNKWCFSELQKKLYVCPNVAVPIKIQLNDWNHNASIYITPVFKDSRFRVEPVLRCYNCKNGQAVSDPVLAEHLVQVEGDSCEYLMVNERYIVSVPLYPPPPGEISSTFLVKLMCLTSCVGGPNRRQFCLVFTLRDNNTGEEIGRQVVDVKCCKCPSRDLNNEDKSFNQRGQANRLGEEHLSEVKQLVSSLSVGQKRKRPNIKLEPGTVGRYENVPVPVEFVSKVKLYINDLVSEKLVKQNNLEALPFPEQE